VGSGPNQYGGTVDLNSTDPQEAGLPASYNFGAGDAGSYTFDSVILQTEGRHTITATDSVTSAITGSATVNVVAPASQVVITSSALTVVAGSLGPVTVQLEDMYGNLGATSTSAQTINLSTTSTAGAFYATPAGITPITRVVIPAGQSRTRFYYSDNKAGAPTLKASDSALGSASTQVEKVTPPPPTVKTFQVVPTYKLNKNGKPQGKPIAWEFELQYNEAMSAAAGQPGNYLVDANNTKRGKTILTPVRFTESDNKSNNTVTLTVSGKNPFAKGGQLNIVATGSTGVRSQAGVLLNPKYKSFIIAPGAKSITLA